MVLLNQMVAAVVLLTLTCCLECAGAIMLVEWLRRVLSRDIHKHGPIYSATLVIESTLVTAVLHGLVILLWAGFYRSRCFASWERAIYFSATSYSTVGYGDLILPSNWSILGPLEGITGVLMCGVSVSVLFALITRLFDRDIDASQKKGRVDTLSPVSVGASTNSSEVTPISKRGASLS
jgi:voltage-gated potassium channel